ncbi:NADH:ubiquinone oxidoreductase subunit NDUFA12 [Rubellimicrobium sp. CFH 75288]|uniref:NADH:ubiquinone oxidoreductase subunit NDUFA12 n=1 Tax=Rubellimicrobium sp. CFH 75288 TaxID=2697034 RepID=UPI001412AADA|nr:NADH:ubiquinone oxidoreductase subunit NDUFA12 [Rubellimicrobium sp. CFH 75288]NAZ37885.1 NADH:ubiquinone oxidoreductase subunit NDUFA12 [Rubellimicrobium sp. CFH 75288]
MGFWTGVKRIFAWWDGPTIGTSLWTRRHGLRVGEDEFGHVYYRTADDRRRWVVYNGEAEASRVPPEWFGWLHRMYDEPPSERPLPRRPWEKPHLPNLTGTDLAYAPPGSIRNPVPVERRDYEAWRPD